MFDKTVHFYLFETDQTDAKVGSEHDFMEWLTYENALSSLSYPNEKEILTKAWNMIQSQSMGLQSTLTEKTLSSSAKDA
jgi:hypothetical protein